MAGSTSSAAYFACFRLFHCTPGQPAISRLPAKRTGYTKRSGCMVSHDNTPHDGITREEIHHRQIDMRGYRRSDGLFEVTACLADRKTRDFTPPGGTRTVVALSPIHDLGVTLVFDADMVVRAVSTFIRSHPYAQCPGGGDSLQALVGLSIGAGWNSEVRKRLPSCDTCTHLKELLGPIATTAYQTMVGMRRSSLDYRDSEGKPLKIDSCYAYGASRDLVKHLWPEYHRPSATAKGS
jgi:hypothetical protein